MRFLMNTHRLGAQEAIDGLIAGWGRRAITVGEPLVDATPHDHPRKAEMWRAAGIVGLYENIDARTDPPAGWDGNDLPPEREKATIDDMLLAGFYGPGPDRIALGALTTDPWGEIHINPDTGAVLNGMAGEEIVQWLERGLLQAEPMPPDRCMGSITHRWRLMPAGRELVLARRAKP